MIDFEDVIYSYPQSPIPAVDHLNLQIHGGEFVLVIGESGGGKSTLLRCINGLVPNLWGGKFSGKVTVFGKDTTEHSVADLSGVVSFVFQDPEGQFVAEKVEDELVFGMENLGIPQGLMRKRVEETLDQTGIGNLRQRGVNTLSGGQRQKVAIGAALSMQPKVLVLDEPTSELDPNSAEEVLTLLQKLNHDLGITVVLSEHRLERVAQYADRILEVKRTGEGEKKYIIDAPEEVLKATDNNPPVVELAKKLDWPTIPLTVKEAKKYLGKNQEDLETRDFSSSLVVFSKNTAVEAEKVWFSYDGFEVLKGVSLQIRQGEFVAVMGRNGSGKTTLIKHFCGLLKPTRGRVKIFGQDTKKISLQEIVKKVGFVPQRPTSLLFRDTVQEELEFTLNNREQPLNSVDRILERFQLQEHRFRYPRDLSSGEQQRVALASILVAEPGIVALDEPTHGMDYKNKQLLIDVLKKLQRAAKTIILVTHDVELVAKCADRVILLAEGQVVIDDDKRGALSESMLFSPQVNKLCGKKIMTVEDVVN